MTSFSELLGEATGFALVGILFWIFSARIISFIDRWRTRNQRSALQLWRKRYLRAIGPVFIILAVLSVAAHLLSPGSMPLTVSSSDHAVTLTFPAGWEPMTNLNPQAVIQVSDVQHSLWTIVINDKKSDFHEDLTHYTESILQGMAGRLQNYALETGPRYETIAGHPAMRMEVSGSMQGVSARFLLVIVEGTTMYHQLTAYGLASTMPAATAMIDNVFAQAKIE